MNNVAKDEDSINGTWKNKRKHLSIIIMVSIIIICLGILGIIYLNMKRRTWKITQYASASGAQAMIYTIEDKSNNLILIDGGYDSDADQVKSIIEEHGNHVTAWIITHPHPDHVGAFNAIMKDPGKIRVDDIYCPTVNIDKYRETAHDWDNFPVCEEFFKVKENLDNVHYVEENDEWNMLGLHVKVLHGWDERVNHLSANLCNKGSLLF